MRGRSDRQPAVVGNREREVLMSTKATIIGAIVWAMGYLVSAFVLKGNPIGDWIEGALLVGWTAFVSVAACQPARHRRS